MTDPIAVLEQNDVFRVPTNLIRPNKWNCNRMTDEKMRALIGNVERIGDVLPVLVRPCEPTAEDPARFEIVDGEHRWRVNRMTGRDTTLVVIREFTDSEARAQTVAMNNHGEADPVDLAQLIAAIEQDGISLAEQSTFLGYTEEQLGELHALADFEWGGDEAKPDPRPAKAERGTDVAWVTLSMRLPQSVLDVFTAELERIKDAMGTAHDHLALEVMAANSGHDDLRDVRP